MEPYLVFSDLDGTLLKNAEDVADHTRDVITKLQAKNVIFYVATGRMYPLGKIIANRVNDQMNVIASNGAVIEEKGKLNRQLLGEAGIKESFKLAQDYHLSVRYFTTHSEFYDYDPQPFILREQDRLKDTPYAFDLIKGNLPLLLEHAFEITNGIIHIQDQSELPTIKAVKAELERSDALTVSASAPSNIELIPRGIDKAVAIEKVQAFYGIDADHTLAFGDGLNDYQMIKNSKIGVAMGNAVPELKEVADYVTLPNTEDGLAVFLEKFFKDRLAD